MTKGPAVLARAALQAYVDKDRALIESLIAVDYHFTSPIDHRLDRDTYFAICWPNSEKTERMDVLQVFEQGDRAVLLYELTSGGKRVRNCEVHTARDGQLISAEVFFGWELPHPVAEGRHDATHS